jgi:hypothetical protein
MKQLFKLKLNIYHVLITLLIFTVFSATILPSEAIRGFEAGLTESIDTSILYSVEDLYSIISGYSRQVRLAYIYQRFTFDLIWPIVYGLFIVVTTLYLLIKINLKRLSSLIYFPLAAVIFDFSENISVSILMFIYPFRINALALLASIFTTIKWITLSYSFIQIIILIVFLIIMKIKKK